MTVIATSQFLAIATGEFPVSLYTIKKNHPNLSIGTSADAEFFKGLGYGLIHETARPEGDVVTEVTPQLVDGVYQQSWEVREFDEGERHGQLESKKYQLRNSVAELLAETLEKGAAFQFDGVEGPLHVQMRSDDRTNISGLKQAAEFAIQNNAADKVFVLRTWEDVNVEVMAADMVTLAWAYLDAYSAIMAKAWALKDAIAVAASEEELPAIPEVL